MDSLESVNRHAIIRGLVIQARVTARALALDPTNQELWQADDDAFRELMLAIGSASLAIWGDVS